MKELGESSKRATSEVLAWINEQLEVLVGLGHCGLQWSGARIA
jgi:hypothetical protein